VNSPVAPAADFLPTHAPRPKLVDLTRLIVPLAKLECLPCVLIQVIGDKLSARVVIARLLLSVIARRRRRRGNPDWGWWKGARDSGLLARAQGPLEVLTSRRGRHESRVRIPPRMPRSQPEQLFSQVMENIR